MIKTTINTNQNSRSLPYPKLMISHKGTIVLFVDHAKGMVLLEGNSNHILGCYANTGYYSNTWDMNNFSDYYQAITLQNIQS
jgi:hypothetical protein